MSAVLYQLPLIVGSFFILGASEPKEIEVFVSKVQKQELYEPLVFGGFVRAEDARPISPEVDGTVHKLFVQLGKKVSKGQLLYKLRPRGAGLDYSLHSVFSPISGLVSEVSKDVGDVIQAGQSVVTVANLQRLEVVVQVTYQDLAFIKQNGRVHLALSDQDYSTSALSGTIKSISPAADSTLGTYPVHISINCAPTEQDCRQILRLGVFVKVLVKTKLREAIAVPTAVLVNRRQQALVLGNDLTVQPVDVKLGRFFGANVEIVSGLKEGMTLVTHYSRFPEKGEKVVVKSRDSLKKDMMSEKLEQPSAKRSH